MDIRLSLTPLITISSHIVKIFISRVMHGSRVHRYVLQIMYSKGTRAANCIANNNNLQNSHFEVYYCVWRDTSVYLLKVVLV